MRMKRQCWESRPSVESDSSDWFRSCDDGLRGGRSRKSGEGFAMILPLYVVTAHQGARSGCDRTLNQSAHKVLAFLT